MGDVVTGEIVQRSTMQTLPAKDEWEVMRDQAALLARTDLVPEAFRGKPDDIVVVMLAARELAVAPITALQEIHVIKGKPGLSAKLMMALVLDRGHEIWLDPDSNEQKATCFGKRTGHERTESFTFSIEDAATAHLIEQKGEMWKKYPKAMLKARAISGLCRQTFPDIILGFGYTPEEIESAEYETPAPELLPPRPVEPLSGVHPEWIERILQEHPIDEVLRVAQIFAPPGRKLTSPHDLHDMPLEIRLQVADRLREERERKAEENAPPPKDTDEIAAPRPDADHCTIHETRDESCSNCKWSGTALGAPDSEGGAPNPGSEVDAGHTSAAPPEAMLGEGDADSDPASSSPAPSPSALDLIDQALTEKLISGEELGKAINSATRKFPDECAPEGFTDLAKASDGLLQAIARKLKLSEKVAAHIELDAQPNPMEVMGRINIKRHAPQDHGTTYGACDSSVGFSDDDICPACGWDPKTPELAGGFGPDGNDGKPLPGLATEVSPAQSNLEGGQAEGARPEAQAPVQSTLGATQ